MKRISCEKIKHLAEEIKRHKRFLVTTHVNPEGDALGSQLALYFLLKKLKKTVFLINQDPVPTQYYFLPHWDKIGLFKSCQKDRLRFDCLIVLDCSDLKRARQLVKLNRENKPILNIDHHISNDFFGSLNWVDSNYSSTAEMIYCLYKKMKIPFDRNCALCLYVGIMTDTGSFRYTNTSSFTHQAVSELRRFNFNPYQIYQEIFGNIPFKDAQLLIKILSRIRQSKDKKITWVEIPQSILRARRFSFDITEYILSFMRAIKDTCVSVLFKENFGKKKEVRFNLRSNGKVDVNRIANLFGGGGHKTAAGGTIEGELKKTRQMLLNYLKKSLK